MKTKTIKIKTYSFTELKRDVQQKVLDEFRNMEVEYSDWWEFVYEDWTKKLEDLGYENTEISFTGFWSQGDGASFIGRVDIEKYIKAHKLTNKYKKLYNDVRSGAYDIYLKIYRSDYHYSHEYTISTDGYCDTDTADKSQYQFDELVKLIDKEIVELSKQIYKDLETEYEYLTSDEVVKDCLEANEYEFLADGERNITI